MHANASNGVFVSSSHRKMTQSYEMSHPKLKVKMFLNSTKKWVLGGRESRIFVIFLHYMEAIFTRIKIED